MGKKKTQESTTKDKIISAASKLFLTDGYEKTSVRKVMNKAGLDFDTFNDFFSSKQELYNVVVEKFFGDFASDFERVMRKAKTPEDLVDGILNICNNSLEMYVFIELDLHWTVRYALREKTLLTLRPEAERLLKRLKYKGKYPRDLAAAKAVADFSVVIFSEKFVRMSQWEEKELLTHLMEDVLNN